MNVWRAGAKPDQCRRHEAERRDVGDLPRQGDRSAHGGGPSELHVLEGELLETSTFKASSNCP